MYKYVQMMQTEPDLTGGFFLLWRQLVVESSTLIHDRSNLGLTVLLLWFTVELRDLHVDQFVIVIVYNTALELKARVEIS